MKPNCFKSERIRYGRLIALSTLGLASAFAALPASAGFVINAGYSGFSSAQQADIASAVSLYEATFTNNITVNINFQNMGSGLGESSSNFYQISYNTFHNAIIANQSGADDVAALAQLTADPINGSTGVWLSQANMKAIGMSESGVDGNIGLNANICFTNHNSPVSGEYDLFAVACHEMDEVLGTVSAVGDSDGLPTSADLFRYGSTNTRSLTTDTSQHAYFSIDGTHMLDEYNQFNHSPGDWGDWIFQEPQQVQDYAQAPGETINPGTELRLLDVVGYTRVTTPEPASMALLGLGVVGLLRRRMKR